MKSFLLLAVNSAFRLLTFPSIRRQVLHHIFCILYFSGRQTFFVRKKVHVDMGFWEFLR